MQLVFSRDIDGWIDRSINIFSTLSGDVFLRGVRPQILSSPSFVLRYGDRRSLIPDPRPVACWNRWWSIYQSASFWQKTWALYLKCVLSSVHQLKALHWQVNLKCSPREIILILFDLDVRYGWTANFGVSAERSYERRSINDVERLSEWMNESIFDDSGK